MKKSRLGTVVTALVTRSDHDQLLREFFRHSTTLGIRSTPVTRYTLDRETQTVETPHGPIRVKQTTDPEFPLQRKPEFEDCAEAARKADISVREVARSVPPASRFASARLVTRFRMVESEWAALCLKRAKVCC